MALLWRHFFVILRGRLLLLIDFLHSRRVLTRCSNFEYHVLRDQLEEKHSWCAFSRALVWRHYSRDGDAVTHYIITSGWSCVGSNAPLASRISLIFSQLLALINWNEGIIQSVSKTFLWRLRLEYAHWNGINVAVFLRMLPILRTPGNKKYSDVVAVTGTQFQRCQ